MRIILRIILQAKSVLQYAFFEGIIFDTLAMGIDLNTAVRNIAVNLRYLRNKHNYTQMEVSHYLEMERKGYQNLEAGKVNYLRLSTIIKILNFYDITFEKLIGNDFQKS
jgi:DNA-binding XRE family transcriptional regulator